MWLWRVPKVGPAAAMLAPQGSNLTGLLDHAWVPGGPGSSLLKLRMALTGDFGQSERMPGRGVAVWPGAAHLFSKDALADAVLGQLVLDLLCEPSGVHLLVHVELVLLGRERGHSRLSGLSRGQQRRAGQGAALRRVPAAGALQAGLGTLRIGRVGARPVLPVVQGGRGAAGRGHRAGRPGGLLQRHREVQSVSPGGGSLPRLLWSVRLHLCNTQRYVSQIHPPSGGS